MNYSKQPVLKRRHQQTDSAPPQTQTAKPKQPKTEVLRAANAYLFDDLYAIIGIALFIAMLGAVLVSDHTSNVQTSAQAARTDATILANELGVSVDAVESSLDFQASFDQKFEDLYGTDTSAVSAAWVAPVPATTATIVFVGGVPAAAATAFDDLDVVLRGQGLISASQHKLRADLVHAHLKASGLVGFESGFRGSSNAIEIEILQQQFDQAGEVERLTKIALNTPLQARSAESVTLSGRSAQIKPGDIAFSGREGPALKLTHSRGGNKIYTNAGQNIKFCTTAFTVTSGYGDAVLSAGHCKNIINYADVNAGVNYAVTQRNGHTGASGDYALYTSAHIEPAEFNANANLVRTVSGTQAVNQMPGKSVCHYGRASNLRTCNHTVDSTGRTITADSGISIGNQARVNNPVSADGDSGGGWSYSRTAYGITTGHNATWDYFTPVTIAASNMGATVKTA